MIILGTIAVLSALFYYFLVKPLHYWKDRGVNQSNPKIIFGDIFKSFFGIESLAENMDKIYRKFPDSRYFGFYQFNLPLLVLRDPELIKQITVKDSDHFIDRLPFVPADVDPLWGKNLTGLTGDDWRNMRTSLTPTFTSNKMKYMFSLIIETAEDVTSHLSREIKEIKEIEIRDVLTRFTHDCIATTAFGVKVNSLENKTNEFYTMSREAANVNGFWKNIKVFGFLVIPNIYKMLGITFFNKKTSTFFRNIIKEILQTREKNGILRNDMINLLIEKRKTSETDLFDDENVTAQALVFLIAGFDSVANLLSFLSYELAVHQEVQDKLREEIQNTLEACDGKITYEALQNMKYMEMVILEASRKWPNLVNIDRVCTKPYTIEPKKPGEKPIHLKYNDAVLIPVWSIQYDEENFPNAEKFDPERFSDENKDKIKPYTYLTFGSGPRNCIGSRLAIIETKAIVFHLLSKFKIVPGEKTVIPIELTKSVILTSANDFWFKLQKL